MYLGFEGMVATAYFLLLMVRERNITGTAQQKKKRIVFIY